MWQDIALLIGNGLIGISLIPQLYLMLKNKSQISIVFGVITISVLSSFVYIFYTLNLYCTAFICMITTGMWINILGVSIMNRRKEK